MAGKPKRIKFYYEEKRIQQDHLDHHCHSNSQLTKCQAPADYSFFVVVFCFLEPFLLYDKIEIQIDTKNV